MDAALVDENDAVEALTKFRRTEKPNSGLGLERSEAEPIPRIASDHPLHGGTTQVADTVEQNHRMAFAVTHTFNLHRKCLRCR